MSEQEIKSVIESLRNLLSINSFGWIVDQTNEEIRRGMESIKSVKDIGLSPTFFEGKPGKHALGKEVGVSEAYSLQQELEILIQGIKNGLVEPYKIAAQIFDGSDLAIDSIQEISVAYDDERYEKIILTSKDQLREMTVKSTQLMILLEEITIELKNAN